MARGSWTVRGGVGGHFSNELGNSSTPSPVQLERTAEVRGQSGLSGDRPVQMERAAEVRGHSGL